MLDGSKTLVVIDGHITGRLVAFRMEISCQSPEVNVYYEQHSSKGGKVGKGVAEVMKVGTDGSLTIYVKSIAEEPEPAPKEEPTDEETTA